MHQEPLRTNSVQETYCASRITELEELINKLEIGPPLAFDSAITSARGEYSPVLYNQPIRFHKNLKFL